MIIILNVDKWKPETYTNEITPLMDLIQEKQAYMLADMEMDEDAKLINPEDQVKMAELDGLYAAEMLRTGMPPEDVVQISKYWD